MKINFRTRVRAYAKYNLLVTPVVILIYLPYNLFFLGYSPVQFIKWILTGSIVGAIANIFIQPWVTFIYRKGWISK